MSVIYSANPWSSGHGYQPSFQDSKLPYLKAKSKAEVQALENTQDYKDFTWYAGGGYNEATGEERVGELANRNSEFTKQYIQALV
jgi:predicted ATP-binding protein involved in virulence